MDERVILRQRSAGLGFLRIARRVVAGEQVQSVLVEAEVDVVHRDLDYPLGIGREMTPERVVGRAEQNALVAQEVTGGVLLQPLRCAVARISGLAFVPEQRHLQRAARTLCGLFRNCSSQLIQRGCVAALAGVEHGELQLGYSP